MAVRIAKMEDVPYILGIYAPYVEQTAYTFEYTVPSVEEFTKRFLDITKQFPWLVWEEDGHVDDVCVWGGQWIVVVEKGAIYDFLCPHLARAV